MTTNVACWSLLAFFVGAMLGKILAQLWLLKKTK
jgi:hypothetical protein